MHDLDDIDIEPRMRAALDSIEPSADLSSRIGTRVTKRERNQRAARGAVAIAALVVVVAASAVAVARSGDRDRQGVVASQPPDVLHWSTLPNPPIAPRRDPVGVWTGKEAIFWGGETVQESQPTCTSTTRGKKTEMQCSVGATISARSGEAGMDGLLGDGAAYDPVAKTWRILPAAPIGPRAQADALWTGTEMIVWGGWRPTGPHDAAWRDGAAYNPATNTWRTIPEAPITSRLGDDVTWTGQEMVVVGGSPGAYSEGSRAIGAAYNPATNTWRLLPDLDFGDNTTGAYVVWTGEDVLYWRVNGRKDPGTGMFTPLLFAYRPATNQWRSLASPYPQFDVGWSNSIVSFGDGRLIVAAQSYRPKEQQTQPGGRIYQNRAQVLAYDPSTDSWAQISNIKLTDANRSITQLTFSSSVWNGRAVVTVAYGSGSVLNPATGSWRPYQDARSVDDSRLVAARDRGEVFVLGHHGEFLVISQW